MTTAQSRGSPLFLPNGAHIFNQLVSFLRAQYLQLGIEEVITPSIYKRSLWETSGHWENFGTDMFEVRAPRGEEAKGAGDNAVNAVADEKPSNGDETAAETTAIEQEESSAESFGLKPMNCPGHCLIFGSRPRSYRELPLRLADFGVLHRNENSGALTGLTRVRAFHQDDVHIFCRPQQIQAEIARALAFVALVQRTLLGRRAPYELVLSTRPKRGFVGSIEAWNRAEAALRAALHAARLPWSLSPGDAAFYGPKIDIRLRDPRGKLHQTATIQLDFNLPARFGLKYTCPTPGDGEGGPSGTGADADAITAATPQLGPPRTNRMGKQLPGKPLARPAATATPVLIHRAALGSVERFVGLLMERYAGRYPFWLAPRQAIVISVSNGTRTVAYARALADVLAGLPVHDVVASAAATSAASAAAAVDGLAPPPPPPPLVALPMSRPRVRVALDLSARTLQRKIQEAKTAGYACLIVVGPQDAVDGTVQLELHNVRHRPVDNMEVPQDENEDMGGDADSDDAVGRSPRERRKGPATDAVSELLAEVVGLQVRDLPRLLPMTPSKARLFFERMIESYF